MYLLLLLALAIAPGGAISLIVWLRDKYEREPLNLIAVSFILGALAIFPAIALELLGESMFGEMNSSDVVSSGFHAFFVVGLSEELCKFAVLLWYAYRKSDFNEPFDGIVYAVMVSMGFATLENIMYVLDGGISTALLRMFLSVPAHASFAIIMGYFVGMAKFRGGEALALMVTGLLAASVLHGFFDFFLFLDNTPLLALGALFSLVIGLYLSNRAMRHHNEISPFRAPDVQNTYEI